jgi:hypothetical protein
VVAVVEAHQVVVTEQELAEQEVIELLFVFPQQLLLLFQVIQQLL